LHCAVDDHSRLAYVEAHRDEKAITCADFLCRAYEFYAQHGISVQAVMTDNAKSYRTSRVFQATLADLNCRQLLTPYYHPQVNGKVERFNRTLLEEWAYVRLYTSNSQRLRLLSAWLHRYNFHRAHSALGGLAPVTSVNNLYVGGTPRSADLTNGVPSPPQCQQNFSMGHVGHGPGIAVSASESV
jgi:transposase InsO family protein